MDDINIGDLFLGNIGGVVPGFSGTLRPVRVINKQKHYVECETIPYEDAFGNLTDTYRIDYFPMELNYRFENMKRVRKWMLENPMGLVMFADREAGVHPKTTWNKKLKSFFGEVKAVEG